MTAITMSYRMGISTVQKIIKDVFNVLWNHLMPIFMPVLVKKVGGKWLLSLINGGTCLTAVEPLIASTSFWKLK